MLKIKSLVDPCAREQLRLLKKAQNFVLNQVLYFQHLLENICTEHLNNTGNNRSSQENRDIS